MLLPNRLYADAYHKITESARQSSSSVLVFAADDVDSVAACRIFVQMLQTDHIPYEVHPVRGYGDIRAAIGQQPDQDEVRSVVMINCGGTENVRELLAMRDSERTVYIVDSHRPYNLYNVYAPGEVLLFDDGSQREDFPVLDEELERIEDGSESSDYYSDSASEDESEPERSEAAVSGASDGDTAEQNRAQSGETRADRRARRRLRERKRKYQAEIDSYYSGTYYGTSAAGLMFELASQCNIEDKDLLWMGILGLTDQYIHERIDSERYAVYVQHFYNEVRRVTGDEPRSMVTEDGTEIPAGEENRIMFEKEYRFMLLRHWTLYDSMFHSSYVASRLGLWKQTTRKRLQTFLAKMGLPLQECTQKFSFMGSELKNQLREKIVEYGPEFGITEPFYDSFYKQHGYSTQFSAGDLVHAATALLGDYGGSDETQKARFWNTYNVLQCTSAYKSMLQQGLEQSIRLQEAIVRQGLSMIEKRAIVTLTTFRYSYIMESPDLRLFLHPLALVKLGYFLMDVAEDVAKRRSKPVVLCALQENRGTYLVVGVMGRTRQGTLTRNNFGEAFRRAAEDSSASIKHDFFDSAVAEIAQVDAHSFMEDLNNAMVP